METDVAEGAERPAKVYCWRFGNAEFDEARWKLRVAGQDVELEHKPLEVLQYLLRHAGEAVTKEELLSSVWAGRVVVEAVLTNAVGKLRRALGDETQDIVATLPRVGYRLAVPASREAVAFLPDASRLGVGDAVPRRPNWRLDSALARSAGNEVWLARHAKTHEVRVFKFSLDGRRLSALKREVTVGRLLEQALGPRVDFVRIIDWDFEQAPYFVEFEYGGVGLDRWTDERGQGIASLPLESRLALFAEAAGAVAAAHGVGVLHKDLKPANLLVHGQPGNWHLRVADFGSSRIFESGYLDELGITGLGLTQTQLSGTEGSTPLYLAPELVGGAAPTVKSDIYALGVTLYQILAGNFRRPLSAGWEADVADPLLRQDIADAANGDPGKRPESAASLAERIRTLDGRREQRALEDAVRARIAEGEKRLAKVRARRPWMIAATSALALGLAMTGVLLNRSLTAERAVAEQRDRAEKQAARAEAVVQYLSNDLIGAINAGASAFEREPTIRELLEYASEHEHESFPEDPATRGSLHTALGRSWMTLGDRDRSEHHLRSAVAEYSRAFGEGDELTLMTRYDLVNTLSYSQKYDEAGQALVQADTLAGTRLDEDTKLAYAAARARAILHVQQQDIGAAEQALLRLDALQRRVYPEDALRAAAIRVNVSDVMLRQGKAEEAVGLLEATLADPFFGAEHIGDTHVSALNLNLARGLRNLGRYAEALPLAVTAAAASERVYGPDEYQTLVQKSAVARIQMLGGDCAGALQTMRAVRKGMVDSYGIDKQATQVETGNLAGMEYECGDREAAVSLMRGAVADLQKQNDGPRNVHSQVFRFSLAEMFTESGRYDEALSLLQGLEPQLLTAGDSRPGWPHRLAALRGRILVSAGKVAEGRALLREAVPALVALGIDDREDLEELEHMARQQ